MTSRISQHSRVEVKLILNQQPYRRTLIEPLRLQFCVEPKAIGRRNRANSWAGVTIERETN
jgi:hypothetical protein